MLKDIESLEAEGRDLQALVAKMPASDWDRPTPFKQWTVWDVIAHLHLSDQWALASIDGPAAFSVAARPVLAALQSGRSLSEYTRDHFRALPGSAVLDSWRACFETLIERARGLDSEARLTWFGPGMGARMFMTARYMETWAHGQDIYDFLARERRYSDDIRAIATLGVKTFRFSFANRGLPVPVPEPHVRLTAPSGAIWVWNAASDGERIEGLASDFCHVVTQGRNIADTGLVVRGEVATSWMSIAQCFAGPPETPPSPGSRTTRGVNFQSAAT